MSTEKLSVDNALSFGWNGMKKHFVLLFGILTATSSLTLLPGLLGYVLAFWVQSDVVKTVGGLTLGLVAAVLHDLIDIGMINVQLRLYDGKTAGTKDVFTVYRYFWRYVGAGIIYKTMMVFGYICLIIPGIIVQLTFQFYGYFIVDRNMGPIEALKASAAATKDVKLNLFGFGIALYFINAIGTLAFMLLLPAAYMINILAMTHVYRQLLQNTPEFSGLTSKVALEGSS
jgi:uncharacterized membrane protein